LGIILVAGMLGYVLWIQGTFKSKEKIAIITWNQDPFWEPVKQGAEDAAKEFGVDLNFIESKPDVESQNQVIQAQLDSGVQAMALSPNNPKAQRKVIDDAAKKVVLITFDSDAPLTMRRGFVGTNDYAAGQQAGEQVRTAIPDGGGVIISVGSVEMANGRDRRQGLIDDLLDRPYRHDRNYDDPDAKLKGDKYEIVATIVDGGDADKAASQLADAIKAHPDVKCVVGLFSYSGSAILKAVNTAGRKDQIKVVSFDESPEVQAAVASGAIYSSILQDQYRCGYESVRVLADMLRGVEQNGPVSARLTEMPVLVMQADNIAALREQRIIRKVSAQ
jgi:ribose transport system substrate-binding protein